jgi:rubrerythrin
MRNFITAVLVGIALALAFALALNSFQQTTQMAFTTEGVRLDATSSPSGKVSIEMTDAIVNGAFVILGAIIAAAAGYFGAVNAAGAQIGALKDQSEEERTRFQQRRHQKKYEIALALHLEAKRLGLSAQKRIPVAQASRSGSGRHPIREQMTISVFPIIRGEREDIGLLRDELQDEARHLVTEVDDYNSHIETLPRTPGGPISVDQDAEHKLISLRDRAESMAQRFDAFISKVREWRCKRCEAFIDEILDVSADGQRKSCPVCNDMTRLAQVQASMGAQSKMTAAADVVGGSSASA